MSNLTERPPLARCLAIHGNVLMVDRVDALRVGMKIVADDDRHGQAPRAGRTAIEDIDVAGLSVTVESVCAANLCSLDYIFEAPPTPEELLDRRLTALESGVAIAMQREAALLSGEGCRARPDEEERVLWREITLTAARSGTTPWVAARQASQVLAEYRREFGPRPTDPLADLESAHPADMGVAPPSDEPPFRHGDGGVPSSFGNLRHGEGAGVKP